MKARGHLILAWGFALAVSAAAGLAWWPDRIDGDEGTDFGVVPAPASLPETRAMEAAARQFRDANPFRLERQPTEVPFGRAPDPTTVIQEPAEASTAYRPELAVAGIIGGPPWAVLIEGLPGVERGVLLRVGDEAHGVTVRWIRGDTVEVSGFDTTWTLTPKRPWT